MKESSNSRCPADTTVSAPGKIILCGEHAVVYGKEALAFAINLRTTCSIGNFNGNDNERILQVEVPALNIDRRFDVKEIHTIGGGGKDDSFVKATEISNDQREDIIKEMDKRFLYDVQEFNEKVTLRICLYLFHLFVPKNFNSGIWLSLASELPIGAGLGSSASFCVSMVASFLFKFGFLSKMENWKREDYELINKHAYQMECLVHGTPSGIDNSISTYGHALSFQAGKLEYLTQLKGLELMVLVINTKESRSTKKLVANVRKMKEKFPALFDNLFNSMECVTQEIKRNLTKLSDGIDDVEKVYEDIEVLIDINESLLESIGVGHTTISKIISVCRRNNLHAKLTGAGGGGCVFAIIPPRYCSNELEKVKEELKNEGLECWVTKLGAPGVLLH